MPSSIDLLNRLRTAIDDVAGDKSIFKENLRRSVAGDQVDGTNKSFQLNNRRVVTGTLSVSADGAAFTTPASEDVARGRFTLASAPATSLKATYDFQFFTDAEATVFLNQAVDFIDGLTDPALVPAGLVDAFIKKAASDACYALATRTTPLYNASAGGKVLDKDNIAVKYRQKAKDLLEQAVAERTAFYGDRKGQSSSPAYGSLATTQKPWTPRR